MNKPPQYPLRFLRWFCREDYIDEIEGDLIELFEKRVEKSPGKARWRFVWDVGRSFRVRNIRSFRNCQNSNHTIMFLNYLIVAFRIFKKEKGYTVANVLGLSLGISCSLFIYLWVDDELKYNNFFDGSDNVCLVMSNVEITNGTYHSISYNLKGVLEENYPFLKNVAVLSYGNWMAFSKGETLMDKAGIDASPEIFDMLKVKFLKGSVEPLRSDLNAIAISASFAQSLYGDDWPSKDIVGESIVNEKDVTFMLAGVFEDIPEHSTLKFEFVLPFALRLSQNEWLKDWDNNASQIYVELADNVSLDEANHKITHAVTDHRGATEHRFERNLFLIPFGDLYLHGRFENGKVAGGRIDVIRILSGAAVMVLLLAVINFTNMATARSSRRAKETGVRKVLGSHKSGLRVQLLTESILVTFFSLLAALAIVYSLLPVFNHITGKNVSPEWSVMRILSLLALVFATGILAGLYPTFYLSSIKPVQAMRGTYKHLAKDLVFRKGLIVFQFVITIIMIAGAVMLYRQLAYIQSKDIGLERAGLIRSWANGISSQKDYGVFKDELLKKPGISGVTLVNTDIMDVGHSTTDVKWNGKLDTEAVEFHILSANPDLIPTAGIELKEGRNFNWKLRTDTANFIINETAQKLMGLDEPIGTDLQLWDLRGKIVGVVRDFHNAPLFSPIQPMIIRFDQSSNWMILARAIPGQSAEAVASLREVYLMFNSKRAFNYEFMDDVFNRTYKGAFMIRDIAFYFTIISIVISCLGLYALVAYTVQQRTREIGIRKVLGAPLLAILQLLSKEILLLLSFSLVIAVPVARFFLTSWLEGFAYRAALSWWLFIGAGSAVIIISLAVVMGHVLKAATANPIKSLRTE